MMADVWTTSAQKTTCSHGHKGYVTACRQDAGAIDEKYV